jgi:leucyl/phenylalanyl-tRNA--protein transferase
MELSPEILLRAYSIGVFPMAESRDDPNLYWIDPEKRGILPLDAVHVPRRLRRTLRRNVYEVRCDTAFTDVIRNCATATGRRPETWINEEIIALYSALFEMGQAHSVECWREGELVGGLYGVTLGAAFFGESMFSRARDSSKVALIHLVARLRRGGFQLLDTQFVTGHLQRFGTIEIERSEYRKRLAAALATTATFHPELSGDAMSAFLQSITQTS